MLGLGIAKKMAEKVSKVLKTKMIKKNDIQSALAKVGEAAQGSEILDEIADELEERGFIVESTELIHVYSFTDFKMNELKDYIPGGVADSKTIEDVATMHKVNLSWLKEQHKKGIKIESEHTTDPKVAAEIALDHLTEDPKYYIKLASIE